MASSTRIAPDVAMLNLVVVIGELARPAQLVELPSGTRLAMLEVTVRRLDAPAEVVPVSWQDPAGWIEEMQPGSAVAVSGRVRRRFFRAGGTTQSRTEVVAERVVKAGAGRMARSVVSDAADRLLQVAIH